MNGEKEMSPEEELVELSQERKKREKREKREKGKFIGTPEEKSEDYKSRERKEPPIETDLLGGLSALAKFFLAALFIPAIVLFLLGMFYEEGRSVFIGLGIIFLGFFVFALIKGFRAVPEMEEWVVELFKRYYETWEPGLHFIIPISFIMRIRSTITVGSTKLIKIFMTEDDKLEFADDSAGLQVHIKVRALGSYGPTYRVMFTDEEIEAIEKAEKDKDHDLLPEDWMYFAMAQVEAAVRGVCGGYSIDDAIKAVSYAGPAGEIKKEFEIDAKIPAFAKEIANEELAKYEILVEEILLRNITLNPDTDKKRRQIQLEAKQVLIEEQKLKQEKIKAEQERQKGLGIKKRLDSIIEGKVDKEGREVESSGLTRADAMKFEVAMKATETIGQVNVLSGGEGKEPVPFDVAARIGAAFGTGQQSISKESVERKKRKKTGPEEIAEETTEKT